MGKRDFKPKYKPPDESDDPWGWIAIIFAAVLALVLVIQTSPSVRGIEDGPPVETKSG